MSDSKTTAATDTPVRKRAKRKKKTTRKRKTTRRRKKAASGSAAAGPGRSRSRPFPPVLFASILRLGEAIQEHGAGQPTRRLTLFDKIGRSPESSASRLLITNSNRYGVTTGSYKAEHLELTKLGATATSPESSARAKLEARFRLSIESVATFKSLYDKNQGKRVPSPEVLRDSLADINVAENQRKQCVDVFLENLKDLNLLRTIAGAERIVPIAQALEEIPGGQEALAPAGDASDVKPAEKRPAWKRLCFVIAPIGDDASEERKHSDMMLEALIRRALEDEWDVRRADEITSPGMISGQVIEYLLNSALVIADLSFHNPNVFYELAIRHMIGKPTVHLVRKGDGIPFDLKDFRTITIDTNDKYTLVSKLDTYRAEIANHVRQAVAEKADTSNPVRTFAKGLTVTLP